MNIKMLRRPDTGAADLASFLNTRPELHFSFADTSALKEGIERLGGQGPAEARAEPRRPREELPITEVTRRR